MSKFNVVTIGSAVKDIIFYTTGGKIILTPHNLTAQKMLAFEYGAKNDITASAHGFGGGAANSAVTFSRLKLKTAIVASVGRDIIGQEISSHLRQERINTSFIQQQSKQLTAMSFIVSADRKDEEHIVFTDRGASSDLICDQHSLSGVTTDWLYLTGLTGAKAAKNISAIFNLAGKKKFKIAWNLGAQQLQAGKRNLSAFLRQTEVLILNKDEAIELALSGIRLGRKNPNHLNRPVYLLNILHDWGPKIVVITDGKKGAYAYDGRKIYKQSAARVKVVNTIGVGDAFGSAFVASLMYTKNNITQALRWGMANSGSVVATVGAQAGILTLTQLKEKINH